MEKYLNYKLCYVESSDYTDSPIILFFTELNDISKQWGDDWDDRPYEHNAGRPYTSDYSKGELGVENGVGIYEPIDIYKVVIDKGYNIFTPRTNQMNSPYSVEDINNKIVPWLTIIDREDNPIYIQAGTTLKDVLDALKKSQDYLDIYAEYRLN